MIKTGSNFTFIPQLDGLRGLAILMVLFHHAGCPLAIGGFIGVDIFFVLSGFLITSIIIKEFIATGTLSFKNFYMRRILRLFPLLLLVLAIYLLISFFIRTRSDFITELIDSGIALIYMTNWAWAFSLHAPDVLRHTWSLSIEEQFYLLWPLLFLVLLRTIKNRNTLSLIVLFLVFLSWVQRLFLLQKGVTIFRLYNGLDTRADSLMIGCLTGIIINMGIIGEKSKRAIGTIAKYVSTIGIIAFVGINLTIHYDSPIVYRLIIAIVNIFTASVILNICYNEEGILHRILTWKWLSYLGTISYGVYLIHYPIMRLFFAMEFDWKIITVAGTIISVLLASITYRYYEKPFLSLKSRYTSKAGKEAGEMQIV